MLGIETMPASPPTLPRHVWTADRWGRLVAGSSVLLCLASAFLVDAGGGHAGWIFLLLAAGAGLQLVVTALIGWCPLHQLMKRLGVKDREEVFAEMCVSGPPWPKSRAH